MVSFSTSADSSHVATQGKPISDVQSIPAAAVPNISSITSQLERMEIAAQKGIASTQLRADHHPASSRPREEVNRERKKSDPPPPPQMTPYISNGVRAPYRVRREVLSDDEEEAGTQTVWQIQPKRRECEWEPYQVLQNGRIRLVDDTLWTLDGRVIWVERLPDGRTK